MSADRVPTGRRLLLVAAVVALALGLWFKAPLVRLLTPGETLTVELARDYKLAADRSTVKLAGVPVGVVAGISGDGPVQVRLHLHPGTLALLGDAPSAQVRPTTVLGGSYYVALVPGGDPARRTDRVPVARTRTPVELDLLLSAIGPDAQTSAQDAARLLHGALRDGGADGLGRVLDAAPATLDPAADVLGAVPTGDLAALVTDLHALADAATARDGQLAGIVDGLATTSGALAHGAGPLADTVAGLPETLDTTRAGADAARATLGRLATTAAALGPTADALDPALASLDPALRELRPVLAQLRPLLGDARPVVEGLGPVADHASDVLDDLRGPVLDRVDGPILGSLNTPWHGAGPKYPQSRGAEHPFYEEIGYLATSLDGGIKTYDGNGSMISFQVGIGTSTLRGAPGEEIVARLSELVTGAGR